MRLRKHIFCFLTAVFVGVLLFLCLASTFFNNTIMSSNYHKTLIAKYNIYSRISADINNSLPSVLKHFYQIDNTNNINEKVFSELINTTITSTFIEQITVPLIEGIFEYISGKHTTLPNIDITAITNALEQKGILPAIDSPKNAQKINVSTLLSLLGLENINKSISTTKALYFYLAFMPKLLIPALIILMLLISRVSDSQKHTKKYILISILSTGVTCIISVIPLKILSQKIYSSQKLIPVAFPSISKTSEFINPYVIDCINTLLVFFVKAGIIILLISIIVSLLLKKCNTLLLNIYYKINKILRSAQDDNKNPQEQGSLKTLLLRNKNIIKNTSTVLIIVLICILVLNTGLFIASFRNEDLSFLLQELRGNTSTRVIPANGSSVYSLFVKVIDRKSRPLKMISIIVEDQTSSHVGSPNIQSKTDDTGIAKFDVDKGIYRISFDTLNFPDGYEISGPFVTEVKVPGITEVTVTIDEAMTNDISRFGIIEVEVLNENNSPIEGIKLYITKIQPLSIVPYNSDSAIYSITNPDGIAVFKTHEGKYEIGFSSDTTQNYSKVPKPFKVNISKNGTLKYTLKLTSK